MSEKLKPLARMEGVFPQELCKDCGLDFVFGFSTPDGLHPIAITQILNCIQVLEQHGFLNDIGEDWWSEVSARYPTEDSENGCCG